MTEREAELEASRQHAGYTAEASFVQGRYRVRLTPPAGAFGSDRVAGEFDEPDDSLSGEGSSYEEALADLAMRRAM